MLVVSGLPGGGKSTLLRRIDAGRGATPLIRIDSQDVRERWERRLPRWVPYVLLRPLARVEHYLRLWLALRSVASVAVHDCGQLAWVRRWLAWEAGRRERGLHLLLVDVTSDQALAGQRARDRAVSAYAFARHQRAMAALRARLLAGLLPTGCTSAVLVDRATVHSLRCVEFGAGTRRGGGGVPVPTRATAPRQRTADGGPGAGDGGPYETWGQAG